MSAQAIIADRIFDGVKFHQKSALVWQNRAISSILPVEQLANDVYQHHYPQCTVTPGFIDLQVNGGGGVMFNQQTTIEGVRTICSAHHKHGTAYLLPTLVSDSVEKMEEALNTIEQAISQHLPSVLGIHLEGPWLNSVKRGAHFEKFIHSPKVNQLKKMPWLTKGAVMVTLAPECVEAESIQWLHNQGCIVSCGHSNATATQLSAKLPNINGFTHLFNAMSPLTGREPGVVGTALSEDDAWCSIIADDIHVAHQNLLMAQKIKPDGKLLVVTDAMATLGDNRGHFTLGEETIYVEGKKLINAEGNLVGAHIGLDESLANLINWGLDEKEAIKMISTYPAHAINMQDSLGYLKVGYAASATILDQNYQAKSILVDGRLIKQ